MKFLKAKRAIETLEAAITFTIAILVMLATVNLGMVVYGQRRCRLPPGMERACAAWPSSAAPITQSAQPASPSTAIQL